MDYFPLGVASGNAFCDREQERHHLLDNIINNKPTLIMSPRRYGKTSLALQAIITSKIPYIHIDFFSETSQEDIEGTIIKAIGKAIGQLIPAPQKAIKIAREFFADLKVKLVIERAGISIEFEQKAASVKSDLKLLLKKLDQLAFDKKKKIILFMDEFQRIGQVSLDWSIEAIIREVAQQSKSLMFIFSGSNRHLLSQMFDDRNRPFYQLCDRIRLERIPAEYYEQYITKASQEKWNQVISTQTISLILELTACHPYYVNLLCSRSWLRRNLPQELEINSTWEQLSVQERPQFARELDLLSANQRKALIHIARIGKILEPLSKNFAQKVGLSTSSIAQSITVLEQRDYIYRDPNGYYQLIDPLLQKVISA